MILCTACSFSKKTSWSLNWILFCSQSFTRYPPRHFLQEPSPCQTMTILLGLPLKSDWKPHDPLTPVFWKSAKSAAYGQSQPTLCMNISWDPWTTMFVAVSEYLSCWIKRNASLCSVYSVYLWIEESLTLQWRMVHVCICVCVCIKYFHTMYSVNGLPTPDLLTDPSLLSTNTAQHFLSLFLESRGFHSLKTCRPYWSAGKTGRQSSDIYSPFSSPNPIKSSSLVPSSMANHLLRSPLPHCPLLPFSHAVFFFPHHPFVSVPYFSRHSLGAHRPH